jgi:uncharacterized membrane protein YphA (DoxX/SURF4 family)
VRRALPGLGLAIRLAGAAIWLVAAVAKIVDLQHFHAQVDQYRLLPHALEASFAYTLPFVELLIGLYLLVGLLTRAASLAASFLLVLFIVAEAQAWARGLSLDCGCFGTLTHSHVGAWTIVRDLALGLPTLVLALRPARLLSLDDRLLGLPDGFAPTGRVSPSRPPLVGAVGDTAESASD